MAGENEQGAAGVEETEFYTFLPSRRQRANRARLALLGMDEGGLDGLGVEELRTLAGDLGLEVKGTGANGAVLKADLVKGLGKARTAAGGGAAGVGGGATGGTVNTASTGGASQGTPRGNTAATK